MTKYTLASVDKDTGQFQGVVDEYVRGVVKNITARGGDNDDSRWIAPITYWWADYYNANTPTGSKWEKTLALGEYLGFVLINISNGSGTKKDPDWVEQVRRVKNATHAKVLGYVRTTFGKRPQSEVMQEIQNHVDWYGVDGVFLDESVNGWGEQEPLVAYYEELYPKIKSQFGEFFKVVSNPGSNTIERMVHTADTLMTFETYAEKYLNPEYPITPDFYRKYPRNKFWHVIHDVTKENYLQVMAKADAEHCGYVCLTDDRFVPSDDLQNPTENPYDDPPAEWIIEAQKDWLAGVLPIRLKATELEKQIQKLSERITALEEA